MSKQKIILFSTELADCPCHDDIFNTDYETLVTYSEEQFFAQLYDSPADAAVLCFCSAREEDVDILLRLDVLSGPVPVLTCSKSVNPEFVRKATIKGISRFMLCSAKPEENRQIVCEAILGHGLRQYIEFCWPASQKSSPYISKLIDEIIYTFPRHLQVREFAGRLGIDRVWLHRLCKDAFGVSLTRFLRRIRIHQALRMLQHTNLDNVSIAMQLDYSEESSMAREFRKELGYCPNKARKLLIGKSPGELLS